MDWKMFFGGVAMIGVAFLLLKLDLWAYGKDGRERYTYRRFDKFKDKTISILFVIGGLIVIFISFTSKK